MTDAEFARRCASVRMVITDVDGVLTDGGMYYSEHGDELKKFNVRDGVGSILLKLAGIKVGLMTGEKTELVARRALKLKFDFTHRGVGDKRAKLATVLDEYGLSAEQVAYIGDEINDYVLLGDVGLFFTVQDGNELIRRRADRVLTCKGGEGALRELATVLLEARGELDTALDAYISANRANNT